MVFANRDEENNEEFYPLTISEIADAQHADKALQNYLSVGEKKEV